jgi:hypothetical protein
MERNTVPKQDALIGYLLLETYDSAGFIAVNNDAIKILGLIPAVLLGKYISRYKYYQKNNPDNDGWFFITHEKLMEELNLGESIIRKYKQELIQLNIIEVKKKGLPSKEWLRINIDAIGLALRKSEVLSYENRRSFNNNNNNKNNKKTISSSSKVSNNGLITPIMFDKFWKIYPRSTNKGKALTAWNKLCNKKDRPTWKVIKYAILDQIESEQWQNPTFIAHPATWLNNSRWLDDPEEMVSYEDRDKQESSYVEPEQLADKFRKQTKRINSYDL